MERELNFEVKTSIDLNKMLTGVLMDVRRGLVNYEMAKSITSIADKINKNNVNAIKYKDITKHKEELSFFNENQNNG